jgi:hypothetical protein
MLLRYFLNSFEVVPIVPIIIIAISIVAKHVGSSGPTIGERKTVCPTVLRAITPGHTMCRWVYK